MKLVWLAAVLTVLTGCDLSGAGGDEHPRSTSGPRPTGCGPSGNARFPVGWSRRASPPDETGEWAPLARFPRDFAMALAPAAWAWTGREFIIWGRTTRPKGSRSGAAYDPERRMWRRIAPAPLPLNEVTTTWTGREMIVLGSQLDGGNHATSRYAAGMAYRPRTDSWRILPSSSLSPQASTIAFSGGRIVAWDYELRAVVYSPTSGRWKRLPRLPLEFLECYPSSTAVGRVVFGWYCGTAAVLDVARRRWRDVTHRPPLPEVSGPPVAIGRMVLLMRPAGLGGRPRLWGYKPPPGN